MERHKRYRPDVCPENMMKKRLVINSTIEKCDECPYCHNDSEEGTVCGAGESPFGHSKLPFSLLIPDWCPLENQNE